MNDSELDTLRQELSVRGVELTTLADGSAIALDLEGHQVLTLNHTAALITERVLNGNDSIQGLVDKICSSYQIDPKTAREDLDELLVTLAGLTQPNPPPR